MQKKNYKRKIVAGRANVTELFIKNKIDNILQSKIFGFEQIHLQ